MAVAHSASAGAGFTLTNDPDIASVSLSVGDVLIVAYMYRGTESADISAPTWNSVTLTPLASVDLGAVDHRLEVFEMRCTGAATATIDASNTAFKNTAVGYTILTGSLASGYIGTVGTQAVQSWGSAPSLDVTDGATDDLVVSILGLNGWDGGYSDVSAATITHGAGQTNRVDQNADDSDNSPAAARARVIIDTKAGAASVTVGYTFSGGLQPQYAHVAFTVKATAGGGGSSLLSKMRRYL